MDKKSFNHHRIYSDKSILIKRDLKNQRANIQEKESSIGPNPNIKIDLKNINNKKTKLIQFDQIENDKLNDNNIKTTREKSSIKYKDLIEAEKKSNQNNEFNTNQGQNRIKTISISNMKNTKNTKNSKNSLRNSNDNNLINNRFSLKKEKELKNFEKKTIFVKEKEQLYLKNTDIDDKNFIESPKRKNKNDEIIFNNKFNKMTNLNNNLNLNSPAKKNQNILNDNKYDSTTANKLDIDIVNNINPHVFGNMISPKNSKSKLNNSNTNNPNFKVSSNLHLRNVHPNVGVMNHFTNFSNNRNSLKRQLNYSNNNSISMNMNINKFQSNENDQNLVDNKNNSKYFDTNLITTIDEREKEYIKNKDNNNIDSIINNNGTKPKIKTGIDDFIKKKNPHKSIELSSSSNIKNLFSFNYIQNLNNKDNKSNNNNKETNILYSKSEKKEEINPKQKKESIELDKNKITNMDQKINTNKNKINEEINTKPKNQSLIHSELYKELKNKQKINKNNTNNLTDVNIDFNIKFDGSSGIKKKEQKNKIIITSDPSKYSNNDSLFNEPNENNNLTRDSIIKENRNSSLSNNQINSYTNYYIAKRHNLIKNNPSFYRENKNDLYEENNNNDKDKETGPFKVNKELNTNNINEINNLKQKNSDETINMYFKTNDDKNEELNVNKINSFPTNFFQLGDSKENNKKELKENKNENVKKFDDQVQHQEKENLYIGLYPGFENTFRNETEINLNNETLRYSFKNTQQNFPNYSNLVSESKLQNTKQNSNNNSNADIKLLPNNYKNNTNLDTLKIKDFDKERKESRNNEFKSNLDLNKIDSNNLFDTINSEYKTIEVYNDNNKFRDSKNNYKIKEPNIFSRLQSYNINDNQSNISFNKKENENFQIKKSGSQKSSSSVMIDLIEKDSVMIIEEEIKKENPLRNSSYVVSDTDQRKNFIEIKKDVNNLITKKSNKFITSKNQLIIEDYLKRNKLNIFPNEISLMKNESKLDSRNINENELNEISLLNKSDSINKSNNNIKNSKNFVHNFSKIPEETRSNNKYHGDNIQIVINNNISYFNSTGDGSQRVNNDGNMNKNLNNTINDLINNDINKKENIVIKDKKYENDFDRKFNNLNNQKITEKIIKKGDNVLKEKSATFNYSDNDKKNANNNNNEYFIENSKNDNPFKLANEIVKNNFYDNKNIQKKSKTESLNDLDNALNYLTSNRKISTNEDEKRFSLNKISKIKDENERDSWIKITNDSQFKKYHNKNSNEQKEENTFNINDDLIKDLLDKNIKRNLTKNKTSSILKTDNSNSIEEKDLNNHFEKVLSVYNDQNKISLQPKLISNSGKNLESISQKIYISNNENNCSDINIKNSKNDTDSIKNSFDENENENKNYSSNSSTYNLEKNKKVIKFDNDHIIELSDSSNGDIKNFNLNILEENKLIHKDNNKIPYTKINEKDDDNYNLSDEECTLLEDEKTIITNVPIFKSKRFTSFNIQNNNSEIQFEQIDKISNNINNPFNKNINQINKENSNDIIDKNSIPNKNKNANNEELKEKTNKFSKYLTNGILKSLLVNSFKTKKSISKYLNLNDLISISFVDKSLNKEFKENIHDIIKNMILKDNSIFLRYKIWKSIYNFSNLNDVENLKSKYLEYLKQESPYENDIQKDINRTLPEDITFRSGKINNIKLRNILCAYSNYNKIIGYAQGLNFIVAAAILVFPEEEQIFIFIDSLVNKFKFNKIMGINNSEVRLHLELIQIYLEKYVPKLCVFLSRQGLSHEFFSTSWIITIFANVVNHSTLFKIWDFFLIYGWKFFNAFLISVLLKFENKIMTFDPNYLSVFMKSLMKSKEFDIGVEGIVNKAFEIMRIESNVNLYNK